MSFESLTSQSGLRSTPPSEGIPSHQRKTNTNSTPTTTTTKTTTKTAPPSPQKPSADHDDTVEIPKTTGEGPANQSIKRKPGLQKKVRQDYKAAGGDLDGKDASHTLDFLTHNTITEKTGVSDPKDHINRTTNMTMKKKEVNRSDDRKTDHKINKNITADEPNYDWSPKEQQRVNDRDERVNEVFGRGEMAPENKDLYDKAHGKGKYQKNKTDESAQKYSDDQKEIIPSHDMSSSTTATTPTTPPTSPTTTTTTTTTAPDKNLDTPQSVETKTTADTGGGGYFSRITSYFYGGGGGGGAGGDNDINKKQEEPTSVSSSQDVTTAGQMSTTMPSKDILTSNNDNNVMKNIVAKNNAKQNDHIVDNKVQNNNDEKQQQIQHNDKIHPTTNTIHTPTSQDLPTKTTTATQTQPPQESTQDDQKSVAIDPPTSSGSSWNVFGRAYSYFYPTTTTPHASSPSAADANREKDEHTTHDNNQTI